MFNNHTLSAILVLYQLKRFISILSYHLCPGRPRGLFPSGFTNKLCMHLFCTHRVSCAAHLVFFHRIIQKYLLSSTDHKYPQYVNSSGALLLVLYLAQYEALRTTQSATFLVWSMVSSSSNLGPQGLLLSAVRHRLLNIVAAILHFGREFHRLQPDDSLRLGGRKSQIVWNAHIRRKLHRDNKNMHERTENRKT